MRYLSACLLLLSLTVAAAAQETLQEARERWLRGNYEEATEIYEQLGKNAKIHDAATIGLSRCLESVGDYDGALERIAAAVKASPKNPALLARQAELLFLRGRWDDAEKAATQAIQLKADCFLARWIVAQLHRERGELSKANTAFRWFVRTYTERSDNDKEITDPDELLLVGLAGSENARWNKLSEQFQFILTEVYNDALKRDKNFWPAKYHAGALLLEKYNRADALPAFEKVLAINPKAAEAYVGKGQAALQKFDVKEAEQFVEKALKINPRLVEALHLHADIHWMAGDITRTLRELNRARSVNPRNEGTLGRIAACLRVQKKTEEFQKLVAEVEKYDAKPGDFYFVLGDRLEDRKHFDDAEAYFKKSIELRPMVPWPQNSLGMLYMRMGREEEAKKILAAAFEADEFNVRIDNTLKVLRHLEKYASIKTAHFVLKYDPEHDKELAAFMATYLETIYEGLAAQFQYRPKGPFLIEIFNRHEMFSGRVIAVPDLHTIGACTGRMVAMVSPRGRGIRKPFNWARVLRHELVHIFNLEQTHFLIPHWYTEGLAVISEGYPRPQSWNALLLTRVPAGDVMNLDNVDFGFIRPRDMSDWHMAYCQSQLYVQFMTETYGKDSVGGLLTAYSDGLDTATALQKVCKVDKTTFEKAYRKYLDQVVGTIRGKAPAKVLKFTEARRAHEQNPKNDDLAATLADLYLRRRDNGNARKLAEQVLARTPAHPHAAYVKAKLLLAGGDDQQAMKLLETALANPKAFDSKAVNLLADIYFKAARLDRAAALLERARRAEPLETRWLEELVRVYRQNGDRDKEAKLLVEIAPTDADDIAIRKELAKLYLGLKKYPLAEKYARQALEIDVLDADAQTAMGDALTPQKKFAPAIASYHIAVSQYEQAREIARADEVRLKLAVAFRDDGQKKEAINEVIKVLAHDADNAAAKKLRGQLEK